MLGRVIAVTDCDSNLASLILIKPKPTIDTIDAMPIYRVKFLGCFCHGQAFYI